MTKIKKDYLDDLPEPRGVIQMCEICDEEEATTFFYDFLGNELPVCEKCNEKKLREYKFNEEKFRKAYEENIKKKLQEYKINQLKFLKANGKRR